MSHRLSRRTWLLGLLAAGATAHAGEAGNVVARAALIGARSTSRLQLALACAGERIVSVGERGIVLLSDDQGRRWRQARCPVSVTLTAVTFVDAQQGWAVGHSGVVLHTDDGGETWRRQLEGVAAAQAMLDGARSSGVPPLPEAERLVADGPDKPFLDVHFSDARHGLVVGAYGLILRTADGGRSWQSAADRVHNPGARHLYAIETVGSRQYLVGEQGLLFAGPVDGVLQRLNAPYDGTFFGLRAFGDGALVLFGLRGHAYLSTDAGRQWRALALGASHSVTAAAALRGGGFVLVDEGGRVLKGGAAGDALQAVPVAPAFPFCDVVQATDGRLVLAGARGTLRLEAEMGAS